MITWIWASIGRLVRGVVEGDGMLIDFGAKIFDNITYIYYDNNQATILRCYFWIMDLLSLLFPHLSLPCQIRTLGIKGGEKDSRVENTNNIKIIVNLFLANVPISYSPFLENIRKPKLFWCFQGVESGSIGQKWVNDVIINGCTLIQNNFIDIRLLRGGSRTAPNIYNEALGKPLIVFVKTCLKGS